MSALPEDFMMKY